MEFALVHDNSLLLGPIGFNRRMINSELEDLELNDRVSSQGFKDVPIHFSDGLTHLIPVENFIEEYNPLHKKVGNFSWEIIKEDNIPTKLKLTYPILDKTLDEVKVLRKQEISPVRKEKENTIIEIDINGTSVQVSTSREERLLISSKIAASSESFNYKFRNTWLEVTSSDLQKVISEIDKVVQEAFDWELSKLQEIDACKTIDEVYEVTIRPVVQLPFGNAAQ